MAERHCLAELLPRLSPCALEEAEVAGSHHRAAEQPRKPSQNHLGLGSSPAHALDLGLQRVGKCCPHSLEPGLQPWKEFLPSA